MRRKKDSLTLRKRIINTILTILQNSITTFLFCISVVIITACEYFKESYSDVSFAQLIFHLKVPLDGSDNSFIWDFLQYEKRYLPILLLVLIFTLLIQSKIFFHRGFFIELKFTILNKIKTLKIKIKNYVKYVRILSVLALLGSLIYAINTLEVIQYIKNILSPTTIYEDYYVSPADTKITFPEKKKNLIYIFLESVESSYAGLDEITSPNNNLIPNLEIIALENTHFSNTNQLGGAYTPTGTTWTVGAMFAQTTGIPLSIPADGNIFYETSSFLPGAYSIGEVLEKEGYNQYLMMGSDKNFGGRASYFEQHGNYEIFDLFTAKEEGKIPQDYHVFWGYEDKKLFEYAKEKITNLSKEDKPFNFTMLTVDTHFPDGYLDETCEIKYPSQYANALECADKKVSEFIKWIQEQDFYEDTTIVISGDHLMMGNSFFRPDYPNDRKVYNAFINSSVETENTKNRMFTTLDMFPSTLAAMGVEIEGNRLGLGTNLFSNEKTLAEKLGYEKLDTELSKTSNFYNREILYNNKKKGI